MNAPALECGDASRRFHLRRRESPRLSRGEGERRLASPQSRAALVWSAAALPPLSRAPEARSARSESGGRAAALHLTLLIVLFIVATNVFATTPTSSITGRVTTAGAAAAGVTVTVTSTVLQGERTTVTTSTGRYWLTGLPPGRYDITFSRAHLQTLTKRVVVELARVACADANLEPSEDEESVTSTATTVNVTETTAATSHFSDETFDRLPVYRTAVTPVFLAPGFSGPFSGFLNGVDSPATTLFGKESLEEVTVIRAALPAEYDAYSPLVYVARSRSGGEDFFFSLRDTISNSRWVRANFPNFEGGNEGLEQLVEANAGGRIVPEKLWFFAGAWKGSELFLGDRTGYEAKLTWQPHTRHNLEAFYTSGTVDVPGRSPEATIAALRYTGTAGSRLTTEAVLNRSTLTTSPAGGVPGESFERTLDSLFTKVSYVAGNHVLSAGGRAWETGQSDDVSFFVNDRWSVHRFTLNLGARHEFDRFSPRVAGTFDVRGNGRQAITASLSDYTSPRETWREATLGFASAIGTTGSVRVDAVRRDFGTVAAHGAQADFRYSLFDRFHTGGSYTCLRQEDESTFLAPEHTAIAWAGVDLPLGDHEFGVTAMQRYLSGVAGFLDDTYSTDLALRYSLPVSRLRLTVAVDATNVFGDADEVFSVGRAFRGWVRLRH